LLRPRNLFTYALTATDARVAHKLAGDREMDRRFSAIYGDSTPALFCDKRLTDLVGTTGVGYYPTTFRNCTQIRVTYRCTSNGSP
jgi:hypothetical protein